MHAHVPFHGFRVPLIGVSEDETLQECEDCHDEHCLQQTRLSYDGHFRCDKCTERNQIYELDKETAD